MKRKPSRLTVILFIILFVILYFVDKQFAILPSINLSNNGSTLASSVESIQVNALGYFADLFKTLIQPGIVI